MLNYEMFSKEAEPTESEIRDFVGSEIFVLFTELDTHLRESYKIKPKMAYSSCSMDNNIWRRWNIKYQKSGKSYCTIYPQQEYFMVLVPGKWFEVRDKDALGDVRLAVELRSAEIAAKKATRRAQ